MEKRFDLVFPGDPSVGIEDDQFIFNINLTEPDFSLYADNVEEERKKFHADFDAKMKKIIDEISVYYCDESHRIMSEDDYQSERGE